MTIQFTAQEQKWIERLRKQQLRWPKARWFTLGVGIFLVLLYSCVLIMLCNMPGFPGRSSNPQDVITSLLFEVNWSILFALLWPKCLIGFIFGAWLIGWTKVNWFGNANRMLLLRLLDADQKSADTKNRADSDE